MEQYISKDALVIEIERIKNTEYNKNSISDDVACCALDMVIDAIDTLEVKEVNMEKLGEIARHLIAVKEHIEDMRLYKEEWLMLEKIGYPEKFKAQKGEEV